MAVAAVEAISFSADDRKFFLTAIVDAEMKNLTYDVQAVVANESGDVLNVKCECATGAGPTARCKHVVALLLVIAKVADSGDLDITGSCTDAPQSFKRPRRSHEGVPVPADSLQPGVKEDDDPRPLKFRNRPAYMDELYTTTVNYTWKSGADISWHYRFPSANLQTAMKYHDYDAVPHTLH